jgi:hypothetical protein
MPPVGDGKREETKQRVVDTQPGNPSNTMKAKDCRGRNISVGDLVRIVGLPDLSKMPRRTQTESEPVFRYLIGKYKKIRSFNSIGWAEIEFRIRNGKLAGIQTVWIEPSLLRQKT